MKKDKKGRQGKRKTGEDVFWEGFVMYRDLKFTNCSGVSVQFSHRRRLERGTAAVVDSSGDIFYNALCPLSAAEWKYILALLCLHPCFKHFDAETICGENRPISGEYNTFLWNIACDIYNIRFLRDMKVGDPPCKEITAPPECRQEREIYEYLLDHEFTDLEKEAVKEMHALFCMEGLDKPIVYGEGERNRFAECFSRNIAFNVRNCIYDIAGGQDDGAEKCSIRARLQREWFISSYPLLGGMASGFKIIEDHEACQRLEIRTAAVDAAGKAVYLNPAAGLSDMEMRFVIAHEMLHAGLQHHERCNGRNTYLWNIACDYIINGWLVEMGIGEMPEDVLYDEAFKGMSAENIYDRLMEDIKASMKLLTMRGYGKGDILGHNAGTDADHSVIDDFCRSALARGLEYHKEKGRGFLPAGLIEEIRALDMPVIPWDLKLAEWFEEMFPQQERTRSYSRMSRRQSCTPDIPRPGIAKRDRYEEQRTFGVVLDTSGSMTEKDIAKALGSIASLAEAKEVPYVRVVFCDADAYDAGYLSPEDIAGRVQVRGRGGTVLQKGIDCIRKAADFPADGAVLIITDGKIERKLYIGREHAFLIPAGSRLPFHAKGKVFYFK